MYRFRRPQTWRKRSAGYPARWAPEVCTLRRFRNGCYVPGGAAYGAWGANPANPANLIFWSDGGQAPRLCLPSCGNARKDPKNCPGERISGLNRCPNVSVESGSHVNRSSRKSGENGRGFSLLKTGFRCFGFSVQASWASEPFWISLVRCWGHLSRTYPKRCNLTPRFSLFPDGFRCWLCEAPIHVGLQRIQLYRHEPQCTPPAPPSGGSITTETLGDLRPTPTLCSHPDQMPLRFIKPQQPLLSFF